MTLRQEIIELAEGGWGDQICSLVKERLEKCRWNCEDILTKRQIEYLITDLSSHTS